MPSESLPLALDETKGGVPASPLARELSFCAVSRGRAPELVATVGAIAAVSPFRYMITPGRCQMSVSLTNCG